MADRIPEAVTAAGPGPRWVRRALVGFACLYYLALIHTPDLRPLRPVTYFTEATCLFPRANAFALEYRLEAWPCGGRWRFIDPRPYFPIRPDDKESRFQRLGYFHEHSHGVLQALDTYVTERHAAGADDGVTERIGGIRLFKVVRPFPPPGEPVARYQFDPFAPVPSEQRRDIYYTPGAERKRRCAGS